MKKINFKKFGGQFIEDELKYVKDYLTYKKDWGNPEQGSNTTISIGCDSKSRRKSITYAITIVFYSDIEHNGAHYIFKRFKVPKSVIYSGKKLNQWNGTYEDNSSKKEIRLHESDMSAIFHRLYAEADYLLELGLWLDNELKDSYFINHNKNDYDGSVPYKLPVIHLDLNPVEFSKGKHNKSHSTYNAVMGMLCGYGFKVISKPNAWASSSAADLLAKN